MGGTKRNKRKKVNKEEMKGRDFEGEPTRREVDAAVRGAAAGEPVEPSDVEVSEGLKKLAERMGESFRHELSAEDFAIIEAQEQRGHSYAYKMRRDGTDTAPRDLSSLEGNMSWVDAADGILIFRESVSPEHGTFGTEQPDRRIIEAQERRGYALINRCTKEELFGFMNNVPAGVTREFKKSPQSEYFLVFEHDKGKNPSQ
ncbi:MAG: hypothetical protein A2945_01055 [Candidatus Liptonbacteria bacterium RIFCSPLOWO2_01_FULL_52_25]|uniref:Uncharacterized protein n=1 Tax=Candidatus Liptonbacteria bacterium RIFCSPLOWO2_01_FULL_52_25 TaxID=1798650 RepID=A0A1G2CDF7_9BACT|nr:MAG: hypothetical protein A2945_01055 [Candidatus Liptonbacteria bacterium RIFCSPLOWO2_01_FULL_52_25]